MQDERDAMLVVGYAEAPRLVAIHPERLLRQHPARIDRIHVSEK